MKTGGATFRQHVYANFREGEVYPRPKVDNMDRAWLVDYLLGLPAERRAQTRAYTGHFPFVVTELLDIDLVTFTVLRDPVDRTISYLKHCKRYHAQHADLSLEEIYEDPFYFPCFIQEHQTKIFSMTADDPLESYADVVDVDDRRLEIAKSNLEKVDVIGLSEHHGEFLLEMQQRFGWKFKTLRNRRVSSEDWEVPRSLRSRIADDNRADVAFFEFASRLYAQRRRRRHSEA
jgi:hypothetical protein